MVHRIKEALRLFNDHQPRGLSSLTGISGSSHNDHDRLCKFLIENKWIAPLTMRVYDMEEQYQLTEEGDQITYNIYFCQQLDKILNYLNRTDSSDLMAHLIKHVDVPNLRDDYIAALDKKMKVVDATDPVKEGWFYSINPHGKQLLANGGFSGAVDEELQEMVEQFDRNRIVLPKRIERRAGLSLSDDILTFLNEQDEVYPKEWVDILARYPHQKPATLRTILNEFEKPHGWVDIKPNSLTHISFHKAGQSTSRSFPNPLLARITYKGKQQVKKIQAPPELPPVITPAHNITIHGNNANVHTGSHGTINDNKIDNSSHEQKTEIKEPAKSAGLTAEWWLKLIGAIMAVLAAGIALAKVLGWIEI
jgi:hypothetical protein